MGLKERMEDFAPLVRWERCWIDPALLARLKTAAEKLSEQERDDVRGALVDELAGRDVIRLDQIPKRLRNALKL